MSQALSVNALLVSPIRVRWRALAALWRYRSSQRLPALQVSMCAERDLELQETMPIIIVLSLIAAAMIFIVLPASLQEQTDALLANIWPAWVVQAAPMVVAQSLAMLNAPTIALQLTHLHAQQHFPSEADARARAIVAVALPQIVAHAWIAAVCACLLVLFSLVFGLLSEIVLAIGDLRSIVNTVLASTSPLAWLRSLVQASVLGTVCALAAVLYAWPGLQQARNAKESHRTGVQAMIAASIACALAGLAMNWLANLLGWRPQSLGAW